MSFAMKPITDPAVRLNDEFVQALASRYAGSVPPLRSLSPDDFAVRYANLCDLVVQLLWPEQYGRRRHGPNLDNNGGADMELILAAAACDGGWQVVAVLIVICLFGFGLMWLIFRQF
jgi:hypothetical protein